MTNTNIPLLDLAAFCHKLQSELAAKEVRIKDLEAALLENMYSNSTNIALKLGTEALANKSDNEMK